MSNTKTNKATRPLSFAAIDSYIETNIIAPTERNIPAQNMVEWGDGNRYPEYLLELYNTVPTLRAIINGNVDYIAGDDANVVQFGGNALGTVNKRGDTIREQLRQLAKDYEMYGGCALQVIRDYTGAVSELYALDMRFLRTNKDGNVFYYSEDFGRGGRRNAVVYPAFLPSLDWASLTDEQRARQVSSVLMVKTVNTQVYPAPLYAAAVKACEIERCIDDYHLNAINNGFVSSLLVNFNNGVPEDHIKEEIEETFNDKFSGHQNAGRIMFSWNRSKETATEIVTPTIEDFGDRYKALSEHSRQQIFTAFRANPNLFGIPTEGNGFANEQYAESYKLYNRTQIKPVQRMLGDMYTKALGVANALTIRPFSLEGADTLVN